ncbi:hypothetical protein FEO86_02080 [Stenotrophomonas maltophilia]|nr:hypothetical protein FEO86_02080 [Stenotrophomonas maltophilia]QGL73954.1 hypothetical protein FEO85_02340 [Stenotrophomonas maltophilia]RSC51935.1 hypothetical protein EGS96_13410 [Stenotrophomonas maltophilia]
MYRYIEAGNHRSGHKRVSFGPRPAPRTAKGAPLARRPGQHCGRERGRARRRTEAGEANTRGLP